VADSANALAKILSFGPLFNNFYSLDSNFSYSSPFLVQIALKGHKRAPLAGIDSLTKLSTKGTTMLDSPTDILLFLEAD